jgi:hypothetical protein
LPAPAAALLIGCVVTRKTLVRVRGRFQRAQTKTLALGDLVFLSHPGLESGQAAAQLRR